MVVGRGEGPKYSRLQGRGQNTVDPGGSRGGGWKHCLSSWTAGGPAINGKTDGVYLQTLCHRLPEPDQKRREGGGGGLGFPAICLDRGFSRPLNERGCSAELGKRFRQKKCRAEEIRALKPVKMTDKLHASSFPHSIFFQGFHSAKKRPSDAHNACHQDGRPHHFRPRRTTGGAWWARTDSMQRKTSHGN